MFFKVLLRAVYVVVTVAIVVSAMGFSDIGERINHEFIQGMLIV